MKNKEELIAMQQKIVDGAKELGRAMTPGETAEFDDLQKQIDALGTTPEPTPTPEPKNPEGEAEQARALERARSTEIMEICRDAGMDGLEYVRNNATVEDVRKAALKHLCQQKGPVRTHVGDDNANMDDFKRDASDAILMKQGYEGKKPTDEVYKMRNMGLRELAIECMVREGVGTTTELLRLSKSELWERQFYNPTAAFPAILDTTIRKSIVHMYNIIQTTFQDWTSKGTLTDFKSSRDHSYMVGGAGDFLLVGEGGELKADKPSSEMVPLRKLDTFGRQFTMSRQAFINDDIGFVTEVPGLYAQSAKKTINKQVYDILFSNPAIYDGANLFESTHNNLVTTGSAPSLDSLQAMFLMLLNQTDPFGDSIKVNPQSLVVPVGYGFLLSQLLETTEVTVDGIGEHTVNALRKYRTMKVAEEGYLNKLAGTGATPWFAVGNPMDAKSIQVDYLNGQELPSVRRMETPGQLGFVWDMWLDWAITVMDFRGIVKNPGTTL